MTVRYHQSVEHLLVDMDELKVWEGNPRSGDIDVLKESIRANGFYQPIIVQKATGEILAGNHRYRAVAELGGTQIPVVYVDVNDVEATRLALADNRTSDLAFYDDTMLFELLDTLMSQDGGLDGTGYDRAAYEVLLQGQERSDVLGGVRQGLTPDDRVDAYNTLDIRSIIIPYEAAVYESVAAGLATLRRVLELETNADVVRQLVTEALAKHGVDAEV